MIKKIIDFFKPKSAKYWENRYKAGGNSGAGSYGKLADFKKKVIDDFCIHNGITSVMEFGCGDGNQISLLDYKGEYTGLDISSKAIEVCSQRFSGDSSKRFFLFSGKRGFCKEKNLKADLTLSLDVLYHLVEDSVFESYLTELFSSALRYVIVYSSNDGNLKDPSWHVKHRNFTKTVEQMFPSFKLQEVVLNKFPLSDRDLNGGEASSADFYIYKRISC